jgi:hypothetical protein
LISENANTARPTVNQYPTIHNGPIRGERTAENLILKGPIYLRQPILTKKLGCGQRSFLAKWHLRGLIAVRV